MIKDTWFIVPERIQGNLAVILILEFLGLKCIVLQLHSAFSSLNWEFCLKVSFKLAKKGECSDKKELLFKLLAKNQMTILCLFYEPELNDIADTAQRIT